MIKRNLFFLCAIACLVGLPIMASGSLNAMIEFRAICMLVVALFLAMAAKQPKDLFMALRSGLFDPSAAGNTEMIASLKHAENCLLTSGIVLTIYAIIALLANLAEPSMIGPNLALAINSSIYAVAAAKILILPLRLRLSNNCPESPHNLHDELFSALVLLGFPFANYVIITVVLYSI